MVAMLHRTPRRIPPFSTMLADLGNPHPASLAATLDVNTKTARRWIKADSAPRPVLLALFWLTRWGQDEIDAELSDRARLLGRLADAQARELLQLRADLSPQNHNTPRTAEVIPFPTRKAEGPHSAGPRFNASS